MQAVDLALPEELAQGITCFKVDLCLCLQLCGQLAPFSLHNASMTCCCPQAFYEKQNQHRKLTWYYSLGMTVVKANFDARPIELSMSTLQAAIVVLFNNGPLALFLRLCKRDGNLEAFMLCADEQLSFADVKERINIGDEEVMRLLHSLSCAKYKILVKTPIGKTINKNDVFRANWAFTDRMRRIKVPHSVSGALCGMSCLED